MKIYKSILFVFVVIALAAMICVFFPKDGVKIGPLELRFATLESVLTNSSAASENAEIKEAEKMEKALAEKEAKLAAEADSVKRVQKMQQMYEEVMKEHISQIYFPNDNFSYFDAFYEKAGKARTDGRTIRIVHYGDSQIELDRISSTLRRYFQGIFGGGGPGLLPIVQNCPSSTVSQWASENFSLYATYGICNREKSKRYGMMAKFYRLNGNGSCTISRTRANHVRLLLYDRSTQFSATLKYEGFEETQTCDTIGGFQILDWHLPAITNTFKLSLSGSADIYGLMVDVGSGVAVDNVPMRGSSGTEFTKMDSKLLAQCLRQTDVGMIILQYGGNAMPGIKSEKAVESYAASVGSQIRYLKSIYPNTPILFIGPSDMSTDVKGVKQSYPLMAKMVEELKATALANGAAFWNIYEVMGGHNSMLAWVHQGLAGYDYVHFSPAGANKIANYLQEAFDISYKHYLIGIGKSVEMPAAEAPKQN
ncbi:MAG: hypothetical protein MJZ70_05030 [Bacteroidales bacterium]|nr:hypothetical protein [Bacteroidales bacterium]